MSEATEVVEAPRVRARHRPATKRQIDLTPPVDAVVETEVVEFVESDLTPEEAKAQAIAKALELLKLKEVQSKALSAVGKAEKELAKLMKQNSVANFAIKAGEKVYDVGELSGTAEEVDVVKLFAEIGNADAMGLVSCSQGAVKEFGGAPLLAKVLRTVTKPAKFAIRKRT